MVQLVMDRATKRYTVLLVRSIRSVHGEPLGRLAAEVFDSHTREWTNAQNHPNTVFGFVKCDVGTLNSNEPSLAAPCAYNCTMGILYDLNCCGSPIFETDVGIFTDYALVGDRLFSLWAYEGDKEELYLYCINEMQAQMVGADMRWVKAKEPWLILPEVSQCLVESTCEYRLLAWEGFLLVVALEGPSIGWLYDFLNGLQAGASRISRRISVGEVRIRYCVRATMGDRPVTQPGYIAVRISMQGLIRGLSFEEGLIQQFEQV